jgi:hypothetical protein
VYLFCANTDYKGPSLAHWLKIQVQINVAGITLILTLLN